VDPFCFLTNDHCARSQAQRLFNGQYLTNLTALGPHDKVTLTDMIDERTANIYHIGCDTAAFASHNRSQNLIIDGDIETLAVRLTLCPNTRLSFVDV
jgi:hypothetical protein